MNEQKCLAALQAMRKECKGMSKQEQQKYLATLFLKYGQEKVRTIMHEGARAEWRMERHGKAVGTTAVICDEKMTEVKR